MKNSVKMVSIDIDEILDAEKENLGAIDEVLHEICF